MCTVYTTTLDGKRLLFCELGSFWMEDCVGEVAELWEVGVAIGY